MAQSAGTGEITDCISTVGWNSPNESLEYDTKQSDGEALVMLELWGIHSTPFLPLFPGPLWSGVVTPDRLLSLGQIELFDI